MKAQLMRFLLYTWAFVLLLSMTSCELIGDIFKAGVWAGVLLVVGGIVLVIWVISRLFGGGRSRT
jgi:TRAP-type C4-dicarboxylate transport system permease large subunit